VELLLDSHLSGIERKYTEKLKASLESLATLVENTTAYASVLSKRYVLDDTQIFRIEDLLDRLWQDETLIAKREIVELTYSIDEAIPPVLVGAQKVLERILYYLLHNATRFTSRGHVHVKATLVDKEDDMPLIKFQIEDTGVGISAARLQTIFTPFAQGSLLEGGSSGFSLSLAICDQLINLFEDGKIKISSEPHQGTKVTVQGRFKIASQPPLEPSFKKELELKDSRLVVLIVTSKRSMSGTMISQILGANRVENHRVDNERDLVSMAEQALREPDVILCTIFDTIFETDRGQVNGFTLATAFAERNKQALVVVCGTSKDIQIQCSALGIRFIYKPIYTQALLQTLSYGIAGLSTQRQKRSPSLELKQKMNSRTALVGLNVLIAEDQKLMREILSQLLHRLGVTCSAVANGKQCYEAFIQTPKFFDLIFMDCMMPILDGFAATEQIRAFETKNGLDPIPIIALTATSNWSISEKCSLAGMNDCIIKPINKSRLTVLLNTFCSKSLGSFIEGVEPTKVLTVLLVQHNDTAARITQTVLRSTSYEVKRVRSGPDALRMLAKDMNCCDIVLMDIDMPDMDGLECTQKIREMEHAEKLEPKKIFVMSSDVSGGVQKTATGCGATACLKKPLDYHGLLQFLVRSNLLPEEEKLDDAGEEEVFGNSDSQAEL